MVELNTGHDLFAEQSVIGIALAWSEKIPSILNRVNHSDFDAALAPFILAMEEMSAAWKPIDAVTLLAYMAGTDEEENRKRRQTAVELVECVPTSAGLDEYINIIRERTKRRTIQALAMKILNHPPTLDGMPELVEGMVSALRDDHKNDSLDMYGMWNLFSDRHDSDKPAQFARTGLSKLDERVFIKDGLFGILAGYPSDGKTALAIKFALNFAAQEYKVGFFSYETDHASLADRVAVMVTGIRNDIIQKNALGLSDWDDLERATRQTSNLKIDWIQSSGMTAAGIRDRSRARGYDVIFIDYLQLIASSSRNRSRYDAVTEISMSLQQLAKQTGITVIALSQFNRPDRYQGEFPPPPNMSMLRESGQIEQDADFILAVYRDDLTDKERQAGLTVPDGQELRMLKVLKNKTGPRNGGFHLLFDGPRQRFTQLEPPKRKQYPETYYQEEIT